MSRTGEYYQELEYQLSEELDKIREIFLENDDTEFWEHLDEFNGHYRKAKEAARILKAGLFED